MRDPTERHERCNLDRRSAGAWPDPGKLRAAAAHPGAARSDADEAIHPRDRAAHPADPGRARGSQCQTILGNHGHLGGKWTRILKAIVAGETGPAKLAELGGPRLAATSAELLEALHGRIGTHHRFLIDQHWKTIGQLEETICGLRRADRGRARTLS
jgi:hypothetical protein